MIQHPGGFNGRGKPNSTVKQLGRVFQFLTSQQLSCSAAVSTGNAMGSMMQQFERELQYRCGSVSGSGMGNSTESNSAMDGGQQTKHRQHGIQLQNLVVHSVYALLEHTSCDRVCSSPEILWRG